MYLYYEWQVEYTGYMRPRPALAWLVENGVCRVAARPDGADLVFACSAARGRYRAMRAKGLGSRESFQLPQSLIMSCSESIYFIFQMFTGLKIFPGSQWPPLMLGWADEAHISKGLARARLGLHFLRSMKYAHMIWPSTMCSLVAPPPRPLQSGDEQVAQRAHFALRRHMISLIFIFVWPMRLSHRPLMSSTSQML